MYNGFDEVSDTFSESWLITSCRIILRHSIKTYITEEKRNIKLLWKHFIRETASGKPGKNMISQSEEISICKFLTAGGT